MSARFDELLPFYVNGTAAPEDRAWIEAYIAEHPEAREEVDWYRELRTSMRAFAADVPDTVGLQRTLSLIGADAPGWRARIAALLDGIGMRPAAALACFAVIAVQGVWIASLMRDAEEPSAIRAGRTAPVSEGPLLVVNFASEAKETEIRETLTRVQGHIVDGPSALGDYFVRVPAGKESAIAEALRADPIVRSVSLAPGLKPPP